MQWVLSWRGRRLPDMDDAYRLVPMGDAVKEHVGSVVYLAVLVLLAALLCAAALAAWALLAQLIGGCR